MNKNIKKLAQAKADKATNRTDSAGRSGMGATARSYLVPLDYMEEFSNDSGTYTDSAFSGKNVKFRPGIDKVSGGGEGPIRASRSYEVGGDLGKKVRFTRSLRQSDYGTTRKVS
jgi:hypothetical protein